MDEGKGEGEDQSERNGGKKNEWGEKYSRQIILPEIGLEGQRRINEAKVAIVGLGALGSVAAELLVRAGVGNLILIDRDVIEDSNLPRQALYVEEDVGKSKVMAAKKRLQEINSRVKLEEYAIHLNYRNINLLQQVDLILDCTDNLKTRFLINEYCKKEKKKWIYAATIKTKGYVMSIFPSGPCVECFLSEKVGETCDTSGVVNTITFSIAGLQVTEALKIIVGKEVESRLYYYDIWQPEMKQLQIPKNKNCLACQGEFRYLRGDDQEPMIKFCSSGRYQILGKKVDLYVMRERWKMIGPVVDEGVALHFKNIILFADGRVLIKAKSEEEARGTYSKWVGN